MNRQKVLEKLQKEVAGAGYHKLSKRIKINYITLWRIANKVSKNGGSAKTWDAIFKYYGK